MVHRDGRTALNGALAGIISGILLQPLEVLKINLILLPKQFDCIRHENFFRAFVDGFKVIHREEGFRGFYRGNVPSVLSSGLSAGIFFGTLDRLERLGLRLQVNKQLSEFLSSATARAIASLLVNPINIWKTRAEILGYNEYRSVTSSIRKIYTNEGLYGFFKGSMLMMLRDFPFGGMFYVTYRFTNHLLHRFSKSDIVYLTSGVIAGVIATTATHPVEIVLAKTQADTSKTDFAHQRGAVFREMRHIWRAEGVTGLFKGLFPRLIRKPITNAMTFFFYEMLNKYQKRLNHSPADSPQPEPSANEMTTDVQSVP